MAIRNLLATAARMHAELAHIGNPAGIEDDEEYLVGQPDVGDFAEHDGCHPRDKSLGSVLYQQRMYESLLLRRNVALLRQAGLPDVAVVGRLLDDEYPVEHVSPIWKVIIHEIPQLDTRASWRDVLDFREEERTRHLVRQLRRWVKKTVCEAWTEAELQDEVRDLVYEYENHIRTARMGADKGILELVITGAADLVENVAKLRFGKIGRLVSVARERRVKLLEAEAGAPGRELALLSELSRNNSHIVG